MLKRGYHAPRGGCQDTHPRLAHNQFPSDPIIFGVWRVARRRRDHQVRPVTQCLDADVLHRGRGDCVQWRIIGKRISWSRLANLEDAATDLGVNPQLEQLFGVRTFDRSSLLPLADQPDRPSQQPREQFIEAGIVGRDVRPVGQPDAHPSAGTAGRALQQPAPEPRLLGAGHMPGLGIDECQPPVPLGAALVDEHAVHGLAEHRLHRVAAQAMHPHRHRRAGLKLVGPCTTPSPLSDTHTQLSGKTVCGRPKFHTRLAGQR